MAAKATAAAPQVESYTKLPNRVLRGEDLNRPPLKLGPLLHVETSPLLHLPVTPCQKLQRQHPNDSMLDKSAQGSRLPHGFRAQWLCPSL